jgi:hypothetical protein
MSCPTKVIMSRKDFMETRVPAKNPQLSLVAEAESYRGTFLEKNPATLKAQFALYPAQNLTVLSNDKFTFFPLY